MTSPFSIDVKQIVFWPGSVGDVLLDRKFEPVRQRVHEMLDLVQNNVRMPENQNRLLPSELPGIAELRINMAGSAIRLYHAVEFREVSFVLDLFDKKSKSGNDISQSDKQRLLTRLKEARGYYQSHRDGYARRYDEREARREIFSRDVPLDRKP
jgi:phage-related protein